MKKVLVGFEFKGMWIVNPFTSECGRDPVDPSYYGFSPCSTGGGCMALHKELPDGDYILLTDGAAAIPTANTPPEEVLIGKYDKEGEEVALNTLADAIKEIDDQQA